MYGITKNHGIHLGDVVAGVVTGGIAAVDHGTARRHRHRRAPRPAPRTPWDAGPRAQQTLSHGRHLHPRPPRVGAAQPHLAHGRELGRRTCCRTCGPASTCSTSGAGRARSRSTWRRGSPPARCSGIDASADVIAAGRARPTAGRGVADAEFAVGDAYALDLPDGVVRRGPRPPGAPAPHRPGRRARASGAGCCAPAACSPSATATTPRSSGRPPTRGSTGGSSSTTSSPRATGPRPTPAATSSAWVQPAGFDDVTATSSHLDVRRPRRPGVVGRPVGRPGARSRRSPTQAVEYGLSDRAELTAIAAAWRQWAAAARRLLRRPQRRGPRPALTRSADAPRPRPTADPELVRAVRPWPHQVHQNGGVPELVRAMRPWPHGCTRANAVRSGAGRAGGERFELGGPVGAARRAAAPRTSRRRPRSSARA